MKRTVPSWKLWAPIFVVFVLLAWSPAFSQGATVVCVPGYAPDTHLFLISPNKPLVAPIASTPLIPGPCPPAFSLTEARCDPIGENQRWVILVDGAEVVETPLYAGSCPF
jgi:hypothetical protein